MIISHKHKFIFIKTEKTAGTSIEIALSKFCGDRDVITPLPHAEDRKLSQELGGRGAQNYHLPLTKYTLKDWKNLLLKRQLLCFYNHISAREVKRLVDPEVWKTYFKFCVERNPWDKAISYYYWQTKLNLKEFYDVPQHFIQNPRITKFSLSEFIQSRYINYIKGFDLYSAYGEIIVDKVILYENLEQGLKEVASKLNLPEKIVLPHAKGKARKDKRNYRELLTQEDRDKIAKVFAREIAYFGYQY